MNKKIDFNQNEFVNNKNSLPKEKEILDANKNSLAMEILNLEKIYDSQNERLHILRGLNMKVYKGSKCVIVGQSGSGKSTLLHIIGALDSPSSGTVLIEGTDLSKMSEEELNSFRQKKLGLIFQFHYLLPDFTALENVFFPAYMAGVPKKIAVEKAKKLLDDVGLSNRLNHLPSQLSGGERQRVAVARSLINDPDLILADEPTGNLDPENSLLIGELLFSMADKYNKTLILVTHDMKLAEKGSVKYILENGQLV